MKKSEPTLWVNVTTSTHWTRAVVGVVRVEIEFKTHLKKLYPTNQVKLCYWNDSEFIEWQEVEQANDVIEEKVKVSPKGVPFIPRGTQPLLYPILPRPLAYQAILQGGLSLMPERLRPYLNFLLLESRSKVRRWRQRYTAWRDKCGTKVMMTKKEPLMSNSRDVKRDKHLFRAGDILLSVGLDWDYPYAEEFSRLRVEDGVKIVACCYDLIPVLFPQYCAADVVIYYSNYFLNLANSSDLIFCISKQSENDLNHFLHQVGGRHVETAVISLGDNIPDSHGDEQVSEEIQQIISAPFILFVSTLERRKNHQVLYQAYHLLCEQGRKEQLPKLVFVGMQGWGIDALLQDIELDPLVKGLIVRCHEVTDTELRQLYDAALCCVYPSLYEGWGLPVGEALALGKIVLSSNRGSLPEVGGDLVIYIDPWNPQAWADKIWGVVNDVSYRESLITNVKKKYQVRTWEKTAEAIKLKFDQLTEEAFQTQILYAGYDFSTQIGQHIGAEIQSRGNIGILLEGPHRGLPAGQFVIRIWDIPEKRTLGICLFTFSADTTEYTQQEVTFKPEMRKHALVELIVELPHVVQDFEIQCHLVSGVLSLEKIEISPTNIGI